MSEFKDLLRGLFALKEVKKAPALNLSPEAAAKILELVEQESPDLHEAPFLALGTADQIIEVLSLPDYTRNSKLTALDNIVFASFVDKKELETLFKLAQKEGLIDQVLILGHTHPSGTTMIGGQKHIVLPSEGLLDPSVFSLEGSDIGFLKKLVRLNPRLHLPYFAIAAITETGPKVKIWHTEHLLKVKKSTDIDKIPAQTISL